MPIRANVFGPAASVAFIAVLAACSSSSRKDAGDEKKPEPAPALADDAVVGSCMAKDESTCDEYRNKPGLKPQERDLEVSMTKGACAEMKHGVWRDGKACEVKDLVGKCDTNPRVGMKVTNFLIKGDEEMAAAACKDLYEGQWVSSLADDVPLGSCDFGYECREFRNNKTADASTRASTLATETEWCESHEGTFAKGKACAEPGKATAKCTSKSNGSLTAIRYTMTAEADALKDAKELCDLGGTSQWEKLDPQKKTAMK